MCRVIFGVGAGCSPPDKFFGRIIRAWLVWRNRAAAAACHRQANIAKSLSGYLVIARAGCQRHLAFADARAGFMSGHRERTEIFDARVPAARLYRAARIFRGSPRTPPRRAARHTKPLGGNFSNRKWRQALLRMFNATGAS
jgi:hypothetical protein